MSDLRSHTKALPVEIHFQDHRISLLFAHLLESMGREAILSDNIGEASADTSIITEPIYFPLLSPEQQKKCLIIGDAESLQGVNALSIAQPLTEKKIESALSLFLKKSAAA